MRHRLKVCILLFVGASVFSPPINGQETRIAPPTGLLPVPNVASTAPLPTSNGSQATTGPSNADAVVPSLETRGAGPNAAATTATNSSASPPVASNTNPGRITPIRSNQVQLSTTAGQYWMEYDIRPYTQALTSVDRPQQAIIDWILRDTGTDVWFSETTGILNADRNTLRVYHNEGMHQIIKQVYERFVNGPIVPQVFGLRIITIGDPNWRQRALSWMKSVEVESPGVHAWLLSKENSAMLMSMLRSRNDVRETPMPELSLIHGQSHNIDQLRSRNYVREYRRQDQPYPAYVPMNSEIKEGYRLQFSPLMSTDLRSMDVALKCSIDQVERLNQVFIDLPTAVGGVQSAPISVPQLVSWRLHERFRWPTDQVLVLSCGVIATPSETSNGNLLGNIAGNSGPFGLGKLLPNMAGSRADALLVIEYKGSGTAASSSDNASAQSNSISRGRY